jgi:hypothetical protein
MSFEPPQGTIDVRGVTLVRPRRVTRAEAVCRIDYARIDFSRN